MSESDRKSKNVGTPAPAPWSQDKVIALAERMRAGACLLYRPGEAFVLIEQGQEVARGLHIRELCVLLSVLAGRHLSGTRVRAKLGRELLSGIASVMNLGETMTAFLRAAARAEVVRRQSEEERQVRHA